MPDQRPEAGAGPHGLYSPEDRRFVGLAAAAVDDLLARNPVLATGLGDHRFDDRLPDLSPEGEQEQAAVLTRHIAALDGVDARALSRVNAVDLGILRDQLVARHHSLTVLRRHEWDPLVWNPGEALYPLLSRPGSQPDTTAAAVAARLRGLGEYLETARAVLTDMPAVHASTAAAQVGGFGALLDQALPVLLAAAPGQAAALRAAADAARQEAAAHARWLAARSRTATRSPRLGPQLFEQAFAHATSSAISSDDLLAAAEEFLDELRDQLTSVSARLLGRSMAARRLVPDAMDAVCAAAPMTAGQVLPASRRALAGAIDFARGSGLLTLPELDVEVIDMPQFRRGVAGAYCDPPGPLDPAEAPTFIAVAPAPQEWPQARRESFYREYNGSMIDNLMVHEGVPGHALQLAAARSVAAPTKVRTLFPSGAFIEGWAVYAEQIMADAGYTGTAVGAHRLALRLQQLKMAARVAANAILDIRFHAHGLTQPEARRLMAVRGFQEEGEVAGKWVRAQITAGQLSTYFAGYRDVLRATGKVAQAQPDWSVGRVHDALLSQGSPPADSIPALLGAV